MVAMMTSDDRFTRILLAASGAAWDAAGDPNPYGDPYGATEGPSRPSYAPRSGAGREMARVARGARQGAALDATELDVPMVLGVLGDALSAVSTDAADDTARSLGRGFALGAGAVALLAIYKRMQQD